jgi:hypothetical protein
MIRLAEAVTVSRTGNSTKKELNNAATGFEFQSETSHPFQSIQINDRYQIACWH